MTTYLTGGYWPSTYWPADYWPEFGEAAPPAVALVLPTHYSSRGLAIHAFTPLAAGADLVYDDLGQRQNRYSHTIRAIGGYWSAELALAADRNDIDDWIGYGLMRHVEIYDPALQIVGEFFVNRITARLGRLTVTVGPALDIANRVYLVYSPLLADNTIGTTTTTNPADDATSQARYGILEHVESGGTIGHPATGSTVLANQQRDVILKNRKYPQHQESESHQSQAPSLSLELLGYYHLLGKFTYHHINTGVVTISEKIQSILLSDPNAFFYSSFAYIQDNDSTAVSLYEPERRQAEAVIKEVVALGDQQLRRYLIGVYEGRLVHYHPVPTAVAYQKTTDSPIYRTPDGNLVEPWDVRPGRWLEYTDLQVGEAEPADLTERQNSVKFPFLESVTFTDPDSVTYQSGTALNAAEIIAARYGFQGFI